MTKLVRVLSWSLLVVASCILLELGPSSRTNVFAALRICSVMIR